MIFEPHGMGDLYKEPACPGNYNTPVQKKDRGKIQITNKFAIRKTFDL
jgi:hypothetical protein